MYDWTGLIFKLDKTGEKVHKREISFVSLWWTDKGSNEDHDCYALFDSNHILWIKEWTPVNVDISRGYKSFETDKCRKSVGGKSLENLNFKFF